MHGGQGGEQISTWRDFSGSQVKGALVEKATEEALLRDDKSREQDLQWGVQAEAGEERRPQVFGKLSPECDVGILWAAVDLGGPQAVAQGCGWEVSLETKSWISCSFYGNHEDSSASVVWAPIPPLPICMGTHVTSLIGRGMADFSCCPVSPTAFPSPLTHTWLFWVLSPCLLPAPWRHLGEGPASVPSSARTVIFSPPPSGSRGPSLLVRRPTPHPSPTSTPPSLLYDPLPRFNDTSFLPSAQQLLDSVGLQEWNCPARGEWQPLSKSRNLLGLSPQTQVDEVLQKAIACARNRNEGVCHLSSPCQNHVSVSFPGDKTLAWCLLQGLQ